MSKERAAHELIADRLIHTAEALGLSGDPERKKQADRYRKVLERQLAKDRQRAKGQRLQPA
jgi:hypothetical protein